jgi:hypothetical protein
MIGGPAWISRMTVCSSPRLTTTLKVSADAVRVTIRRRGEPDQGQKDTHERPTPAVAHASAVMGARIAPGPSHAERPDDHAEDSELRTLKGPYRNRADVVGGRADAVAHLARSTSPPERSA